MTNKKFYRCFFIWGLFCLQNNTGKAQVPVFNSVSSNSTTIKKYEKFELDIDLTAAYKNPYDYDDIAVQCIFNAPNGTRDTVDGFYTQDYVLSPKETPVKSTGGGYFKVRYAPRQTGVWKYILQCRSQNGTTTTPVKTFNCITSSSPGFIHTNKTNYLGFDNGTQYIPVGENLNSQANNFFTDFSSWINKLADNNANCIRVWMIPNGTGIEWSNKIYGFEGVKKYNQASSFSLDWLLDYCAQKNMYMMLALNFPGNEASTINPPWKYNPYNILNGGPCVNSWEFFSNTVAKAYLKNRLRYIMARWGYSYNIMSWELFSEVDGSEEFNKHKADITNWHSEMAGYIKSKDLYNRPVSTSYSVEDNDPNTWKLKNIDFTQTHSYFSSPNIEKLIANVNSDYITEYNKPTITGEFGINAQNINLTEADPKGVYFHNVIWATAFSGAMGTALTYWWHNYIDPQNLYYHFKSLSSFLSLIKLKDEAYVKADAYTGNAGSTDIVILPGSGWGAPIADSFNVDALGNIHPKANQLGIYLFGKIINTQYGNGPVFNIKYPAKGTFTVATGNTKTIAPKIYIAIDGKQVLEEDGAINTSYSVDVPAGRHSIKVDNTGKDWIWINQYTFSSAGSPADPYVLKNAGHSKAAGYILNSSYNWQYLKKYNAGLPPAINGCSLVIPDMQNGKYVVNCYNPETGKAIRASSLTASDGILKITIPSFVWDVAFTAEKKAK